MKARIEAANLPETKRQLLDAAVSLMRLKGYNATTVDDICSAARVTKGAFFHYFKSKQGIAKAALARFGDGKDQDFHDAPFGKLEDARDRVYGRLDFIEETAGGMSESTQGCLIGTLAQELSLTDPELRAICHELLLRMARDFAKDLAEAKSAHAPAAGFDPEKLSVMFVSIFQGSTLLAKNSGSNTVLMDNLQQFRLYLEGFIGPAGGSGAIPPFEPLDMTRD